MTLDSRYSLCVYCNNVFCRYHETQCVIINQSLLLGSYRYYPYAPKKKIKWTN